MFHLSIVLLCSFFGLAIGQVPHGVPVQHGLYIPVNATNNQSKLPYPNRPADIYRPNSNVYPAAYGSNYVQQNYPVQPQNPVKPYYPEPQSIKSQTTQEIVYGARKFGDQNLFKTHVVKKLEFLRSASIKTITFPDKDSKMQLKEITQIVIKNNNNSRKPPICEIQEGGVGKSGVVLRLKTRGDMDLALDIFAIPKN